MHDMNFFIPEWYDVIKYNEFVIEKLSLLPEDCENEELRDEINMFTF